MIIMSHKSDEQPVAPAPKKAAPKKEAKNAVKDRKAASSNGDGSNKPRKG